MKAKVTDQGVVIPKGFLNEVEEVEIRKENGVILVVPTVGETEAYDAAHRRARATLERGFHLGGTIRVTRDEWHER